MMETHNSILTQPILHSILSLSLNKKTQNKFFLYYFNDCLINIIVNGMHSDHSECSNELCLQLSSNSTSQWPFSPDYTLQLSGYVMEFHRFDCNHIGYTHKQQRPGKAGRCRSHGMFQFFLLRPCNRVSYHILFWHTSSMTSSSILCHYRFPLFQSLSFHC